MAIHILDKALYCPLLEVDVGVDYDVILRPQTDSLAHSYIVCRAVAVIGVVDIAKPLRTMLQSAIEVVARVIDYIESVNRAAKHAGKERVELLPRVVVDDKGGGNHIGFIAFGLSVQHLRSPFGSFQLRGLLSNFSTPHFVTTASL